MADPFVFSAKLNFIIFLGSYHEIEDFRFFLNFSYTTVKLDQWEKNFLIKLETLQTVK